MDQNKQAKKSKGFTLLELMITLAVASILLSIGVPSFVDFIQNGRMSAQTNELNASLSLARAEAIKRKIPVTVCRSSDQDSCSGAWGDGWIVFTDANNDGDRDTSGTEESILKVQANIPEGMTISKNAGAAYIKFNYFGEARGQATTFTICDDRGAKHANALVILGSGRVRLAHDTDSDGTVDVKGAEVTCS